MRRQDTALSLIPEKAVGFEDSHTYGRYNGSYAQDVEGWSDQDIDDAFDRNPDAYWNID